jgi:hypothetical protein
MSKMLITINGKIYTVEHIEMYELPLLYLDDCSKWYIAQSSAEAGVMARNYWEDMARNYKKEFIAIVGEEILISWALGEYAGPGSEQVKSLEDWLDLFLTRPEEHFASYDGMEVLCRINNNLMDKLNFSENNCVCYRVN